MNESNEKIMKLTIQTVADRVCPGFGIDFVNLGPSFELRKSISSSLSSDLSDSFLVVVAGGGLRVGPGIGVFVV